MGLYRTRPRMVEARQLNAENWSQVEEIATWAGAEIVDLSAFLSYGDPALLAMRSPDGEVTYAEDGDWVVRGADGELNAVDPEFFEATYEPLVRL